MTTHRAPKSVARPGRPGRPAERAVTAGLALAVAAGLAWAGGMLYTVVEWWS
ncbi:hypothetical protein [Streptomyces sp. NPDC006134]|uniref:morphogenic membrane protein MmpA n=1 Tax=Streptomyces sp. NPDC006134 TaxID=3154467 RepID=UPI0033EC09D0